MEDSIINQADILLEEGKFREAKILYLQNQQITQAAYATLLDQNLNEALELYLQAPHSAAKRWGLFLCDFFINPHRSLPSPGVLSFRLYFEASYFYCYKFGIRDYLRSFEEHADSLAKFYPEYLNDMEKVRSQHDLIN